MGGWRISERSWRGRRRGKGPDNWQGGQGSLLQSWDPVLHSPLLWFPGEAPFFWGDSLTRPARSALSRLGSRATGKIMRVRRCLWCVFLEEPVASQL